MKKILFLLIFSFSISYGQEKLPNMTIKNLEGQNINTVSSYNEKDKIYVFAFWATWCAPCIQELEAINDVYADWKKQINIEVIAVSIDDTRTSKRVKPLVNGKGWEYTILLDSNQEFKRSLGITNPPYTLVVKNGQILYTQNGHVPGGEDEFFEKIKSL